MSQVQPFTRAERERVYQGRLEGKTIAEIAAELGRTLYGVRKWWRRIRDEGWEGMRERKRGKAAAGILSQFDPQVVQQALDLKRRHRRWGANRVLIEIAQDERWVEQRLPKRSRLSAFFREKCPECVHRYHARPEAPKPLSRASAVHEVWQLDNKEKIKLADGSVVTLCNIRDPFGAAMIASQAFQVKVGHHYRRLDWTEIRQVLRSGFAEWRTLPDSVHTDNEPGLVGASNYAFPSPLSLWLVGLGISHHTIRPYRPTDQSQIERNHRSLNEFTFDEVSRSDLVSFQSALDRERSLYNQLFPSQASDCAGKPPLAAHPELLHPRRPYQPAWELALFNLQRVYDHLAQFTFFRQVNCNGVVSLGGPRYSLGRHLAGKSVSARFDPLRIEWVFQDDNTAQELARCKPKRIDVFSLTGLSPVSVSPPEPIQLTLPLSP